MPKKKPLVAPAPNPLKALEEKQAQGSVCVCCFRPGAICRPHRGGGYYLWCSTCKFRAFTNSPEGGLILQAFQELLADPRFRESLLIALAPAVESVMARAVREAGIPKPT